MRDGGLDVEWLNGASPDLGQSSGVDWVYERARRKDDSKTGLEAL